MCVCVCVCVHKSESVERFVRCPLRNFSRETILFYIWMCGTDVVVVRVCAGLPTGKRKNIDKPKRGMGEEDRVSHGKERKKTDNPREGWEDGTPPPHRDFKERGVMRYSSSRRPSFALWRGPPLSNFPISLRSLSPILAATFMPPRGRPTLVVLSLVAFSQCSQGERRSRAKFFSDSFWRCGPNEGPSVADSCEP